LLLDITWYDIFVEKFYSLQVLSLLYFFINWLIIPLGILPLFKSSFIVSNIFFNPFSFYSLYTIIFNIKPFFNLCCKPTITSNISFYFSHSFAISYNTCTNYILPLDDLPDQEKTTKLKLLIEQGISFLVPSRKKNKLLNENNSEPDPTQTSIICNKDRQNFQLFPYYAMAKNNNLLHKKCIDAWKLGNKLRLMQV